jgi:hypothetical protein
MDGIYIYIYIKMKKGGRKRRGKGGRRREGGGREGKIILFIYLCFVFNKKVNEFLFIYMCVYIIHERFCVLFFKKNKNEEFLFMKIFFSLCLNFKLFLLRKKGDKIKFFLFVYLFVCVYVWFD